MNQVDDAHVHNWLRQTAAQFPYPPPPDVRSTVRRQIQPATQVPWPRVRLAPVWAMLALLLLAASLLLVPQVRAAVLQLLRAGGITILVTEPTPQPAVLPTAVPQGAAPPATATPSTVDAQPSFLLPVAPVSLAQAQEAFAPLPPFPSSLPPYGAPQDVYVDDERQAQVAILVWPREADRPLVLYAIAARDFATKQVDALATTDVNGHEAYWIEGPHGFILQDGEMWDTQSASGEVLIWSDGDLTYRLEGAASLDEAQDLAAALSP